LQRQLRIERNSDADCGSSSGFAIRRLVCELYPFNSCDMLTTDGQW
jgi:hypothetical protein